MSGPVQDAAKDAAEDLEAAAPEVEGEAAHKVTGLAGERPRPGLYGLIASWATRL